MLMMAVVFVSAIEGEIGLGFCLVLALSCPVLSCLVLSCLVLSWLVLSCVIFEVDIQGVRECTFRVTVRSRVRIRVKVRVRIRVTARGLRFGVFVLFCL